MQYSIVFVCLGALMGFEAIVGLQLMTLRVLSGWAGLSFLAVGLAYGSGWAGIFGKRADGSLRPLNVVCLLPYFLLTWIVWRIGVMVSTESACDQIDPHLRCGRRPLAGEGRPAVDEVIDLTAEFPETMVLRASGYRCVPLLDARAGDPERIAQEAYRLRHPEHSVFIHCAQGHGRTGLFAAAVLVARTPGLTSEAAVSQLRARRPGIGLSRIQRRALDEAVALIERYRQRDSRS